MTHATLRSCAVIALIALGSSANADVRHRPRHAHATTAHRHVARGAARAYGFGYDPTPTCRYPDGTPFDPDIIGGPNHVGDGGPAVNLGGYNPCGY